MKITVKLFATFREQRFDIQEMSVPDGANIVKIITLLKIPLEEVAIIFVNGKHSSLNYILVNGDTLALFPPIGGG
ncbi:MAG: MoaD/ThiS family protein [Deltaproteobacteria bacterium]